ncbi:protein DETOXIFICATION 42-like isoform X5 [Telopea speciosissima]|uniref:protein DETOXIFICATION 42-like isoform X5 n=1 Tax=Telopea speciosissima TaxID=54955 RepID=UPI001CC3FBCC|nr:protein DETOXIFICATION 42-like isoform X5 [Telopea speciosissima]
MDYEDLVHPMIAEDADDLLGGEKRKSPLCVLFKDARHVLKKDELGMEIAQIAFPAAMALTADPIASLIDTAFIGQIGPVELAAVGVAIALFNQVARIAIFPLVSVTTSFVAEEETVGRAITDDQENENLEMQLAPNSERKELIPKFVLLSLAMQGVFRGFKDTKTPLYATVAGDVANIILDPLLIFVFRLGVSGAAIAHVISQYLISFILLWTLIKKVDLVSPSLKDLKLGRFLKNGSLLLVRVIAVTFCVTLAASMAARLGPTPMAAFQVCLQVWLAASLLADGLAVAGQAIIASAFAENDYSKATATASRVLQLGFVLGLVLSVFLGVGLQFASRLFTKDINVIHLISIGIPFVAASQPLNALAFVFDGVNFGASDFTYSAYSMVLVAIISILCVLLLSASHGFVGIWVALTIYMSLRTFAGFWRIGTGSGPWSFLRTLTSPFYGDNL